MGKFPRSDGQTNRRAFMKCAAVTTGALGSGMANRAGAIEARQGGSDTATVIDIADLAALPPLPDENDLSRRYLRIMEHWIPTGVSFYEAWPVRPNCGHFLGGAHWYGMETAWPAEVFACAAISPEYDAAATGVSREDLIRMAVSAVRFLCFTHDTGPADCVRPSPPKAHPRNNGTKWGERGRGYFPESQCTWSIAPMTRICALLHRHIDEETLGMVARVVEDYALRFDETDPWNGVYGNTQTEEIGWTAWGLASAATFLAQHTRAEKWMDAVRRWSVCIAATPQDSHNAGAIAGTPIRDYCRRLVTTLPDYWAENHDMVHPTYTASGVLFASNIAAHLRLFGHEIPEEVFWNRREVYANLKRVVDDYGFMVAIQGMDWNYLPGMLEDTSHGLASVFLKDRAAATLLRRNLAQAEMRLASFDGRFYDSDLSERASDVQDPMIMREIAINQAAWGYQFQRLLGPGVKPFTDEELEDALRGARVWPHAGTAHNRHAHGQTAFSWRNEIMALPVTREGITVIGPASGSYLGQPVVKDRPASQDLVSCEIDRTTDGFAAVMTMDRAQRSVRQYVLFVSLPDGRTVSYERFEAREDIVVEQLAQGELAIINERFPAYPDGNCRGQRVLHTPEGAREFAGWLGDSKADDDLVTLGRPAWVNVDDRIGFVFSGSGETRYLNRHYHKPYHAIHDRMMLSCVPDNTSFGSGETVASLAAVVLPEQSHGNTASEWLDLPESSEGAVALLSRGVLAVGNFLDENRLLSLTWTPRGAVPAFAGATVQFDGKRCVCVLPVAANRAAVVEAAGEVESNGPVTVDVVPDGRWLLTNPGETTLEAVCRKDEETFKVSIQPGVTTILRP